MAGIQKLDDYINQIGSGIILTQPIYDNIPSTMALGPGSIASQAGTFIRNGYTKNLPNPLPTGVTAYILANWHVNSSLSVNHLLAKLINLGSFNIGTNVFTDGSAMPTITEGGVSRQIPGKLFWEVTTALSFTSTCNLTFTYTNQAGTTGQVSSVNSLTTGWNIRQSGYTVLNSGDSGVIDITNITRGGTPGSPSGVIKFWGLIPLSFINQSQANFPVIENLAPTPFRLGAGDTIGLFSLGSISGRSLIGGLTFVGDN